MLKCIYFEMVASSASKLRGSESIGVCCVNVCSLIEREGEEKYKFAYYLGAGEFTDR